MKIVFATNNAHKLSEVKAVLGDGFELVTLREVGITEDIPETGATLEENASQKAHYVYDRTGLDCFADDTGLEVEALNGEPGVRSARYATDGHDDQANKRLLLERLEGKEIYIAKKALIETRKDQYVIKNAFKKPITITSTVHSRH